jgi:hypothetical protein
MFRKFQNPQLSSEELATNVVGFRHKTAHPLVKLEIFLLLVKKA